MFNLQSNWPRDFPLVMLLGQSRVGQLDLEHRSVLSNFYKHEHVQFEMSLGKCCRQLSRLNHLRWQCSTTNIVVGQKARPEDLHFSG